MAYRVNADDEMMAMFDKIAAEPINESQYNGYVKNPKPVVESVMLFDDVTVDTSSWTTDSKKVGKAKTVPTKAVKKVTTNDSTKETKAGDKVVAMKTTCGTAPTKAPKVGNGGSFDTVAKSAVAGVKSKTAANQKFDESSKKQRKNNEIFRTYVKSLGIDEKSTADAEKILKKFDEITKRAK